MKWSSWRLCATVDYRVVFQQMCHWWNFENKNVQLDENIHHNELKKSDLITKKFLAFVKAAVFVCVTFHCYGTDIEKINRLTSNVDYNDIDNDN